MGNVVRFPFDGAPREHPPPDCVAYVNRVQRAVDFFSPFEGIDYEHEEQEPRAIVEEDEPSGVHPIPNFNL